VIVSVLTLLTTSATAYGMSRRADIAVLLSALCTLITVGGGFALLYRALFGSNPSACEANFPGGTRSECSCR
jgi:hypothetical protein